jgi:microsomal dipeptidase-like Zn-dependent dipeptidase
MKKKLAAALLFIVALVLAVFFFVVPAEVEKRFNRTLNPPPYAATPRAAELHRSSIVADLHADSLMWDRSVLERSRRGHVDVPRLIEGNVALQAFTVVTKSPRALNIERNDDTTDNITPLVIAQRWPVATWTSLKERALYQARKLREAASRSDGRLTLIGSSRDLASYLERRRREPEITAGFLGIEGAHALDGDLASLDALYDAGFRMIAPTHFFDNDIGGSAHGVSKGGLTEKGREWVRRMEAKRMIVDLAHASAQTIDDVLQIAARPVVVSHTGVRGTCDNTRNLSDEQLKNISARGGIVGIGYWETAVCGTDARAVARAIRYTAELVGVEHVALGSDFDGAVIVPFDTSGVVAVTDALLSEGFTDDEIRMILGGNVVRFLSENLPQ